MGRYDVAQICLNGHVANYMANEYPQHNEQHCSKCGEQTITKCVDCQTDIRGYFLGTMSTQPYARPQFCHNCGKPYPWTRRYTEAIVEMINLSTDLDTDEKADFKGSIADLVQDTPRTPVAQTKYKKYIGKVSSEIGKGIRDVLVDIASETIRKSLMGP